MAAAQEMQKKQGSAKAASFESIMKEEAKKSQRQLEEEKRLEKIRADQNQDMKFNYIDKDQMPTLKNTIAADTIPDFAEINKNKKKRKK